jgi:hypothetical protein
MFTKFGAWLQTITDFSARGSTPGSIAGKLAMGLGPAIPSMIRGCRTSRDRADRIGRRFVWICKERAFWLVSAVELLYTHI